MAFWYPELWLGYQCCVPHSSTASIFYWEVVTVACAMTATPSNDHQWLVVYTDNQNTIDIWHSLKASTPYNATLIFAIDSLILHDTDAQVLHVPGDQNLVADALALCLVPDIKLGIFETLQELLGALKKWALCSHLGNLSKRPGPWLNLMLSWPLIWAWC